MGIELAAGRAAVMSLTDLVEHTRGVSEARETIYSPLSNSFAASLSLLAPAERQVLDTLSVYAGSFAPTLASGLVDPKLFGSSARALDIIQSLQSKSLLRRHVDHQTKEVRLSLFPIVRDLVRGKRTSQAKLATWRRYWRQCTDLAQTHRGRLREGWDDASFRFLIRESRNFIAAIKTLLSIPEDELLDEDIVSALKLVIAPGLVRGSVVAVGELGTTLFGLAVRRGLPPEVWSDAVFAASEALRLRDRSIEALRLLDSALAALGDDDDEQRSEFLLVRSRVCRYLMLYDEALENGEQALQIARVRRDATRRSLAWDAIGTVHLDRLEPEKAIEAYETGLGIPETRNDDGAVAFYTAGIGLAHGAGERPTLASHYASQAIEQHTRIGMEAGVVEARYAQAVAKWQLGVHSQARTEAKKALMDGRRLGLDRYAAMASQLLWELDFEQYGHRCLDQIEETRDRLPIQSARLQGVVFYGRVLLSMGHVDLALAQFESAVATADRANSSAWFTLALALAGLARRLLNAPEPPQKEYVSTPAKVLSGFAFAASVFDLLPTNQRDWSDSVFQADVAALIGPAIRRVGSERPLVARSPIARQALARLIDEVPVGQLPSLFIAALGSDTRDHLLVDISGAWYRSPTGEVVDLRRRTVLVKMLEVLTKGDLNVARPAYLLAENVWPGSSIADEHIAKRVYSNATHLRKTGLGDHLVGDRDGYRLEASRVIRLPSDGTTLCTSVADLF